MRQHLEWKKLTAALLAILLAAGAGLPCALADDWPKDTVTDAKGNIYKQVKKQDGGVEVWRFVGIFGSPEEALEQAGLSEEGKKGKETIGGTPYMYDLKKLKRDDSKADVRILGDGDSIWFGVRNDDTAKVVVKAEVEKTYITGLESTAGEPKINDKLLFGETAKELMEKAGGTDAVMEADPGETTVLNPGESMTFKVSGKSVQMPQIQVKHEGDKTYVMPFKMKKARTTPIRIKKKEVKTVQKPGTEDDQTGGGGTAEENQAKKTTTRRRKKTIGDIIPAGQIDWGLGKIYIQENRASGR